MSYVYMESYVSKKDGTIDYEKMYHVEDMKKSDLQPWWNNKLLKWCDSFPALCYAHGIFDIFNSDGSLSELFINNFKNVPDQSIYTARICNSGYTVRDQINFLLENKNVIIVDNEPEFMYKVSFGRKSGKKELAKWIANNRDKVVCGPRLYESLQNENRYIQSQYIYAKDEKVVLLLQMIVGDNITRIDKLVSKQNIDK